MFMRADSPRKKRDKLDMERWESPRGVHHLILFGASPVASLSLSAVVNRIRAWRDAAQPALYFTQLCRHLAWPCVLRATVASGVRCSAAAPGP
jgi:hypothetical protein